MFLLQLVAPKPHPAHHFQSYLALPHDLQAREPRFFNNIYFHLFHRSLLVINCQCSPKRFIVKGSIENMRAKPTASTLLLFRRDSPCDVDARIFPCFKTHALSMQDHGPIIPCSISMALTYIENGLFTHRTSKTRRLTALIPGSILPVQTCELFAAKCS